MRKRSAHKLLGFRLRAAAVALLYVFLCTASPLAHTHAGLQEALPDNAAAALRAHVAPQLTAHVPPPATHCAYCEWQAHSVAASLPVLAFAPQAAAQPEPGSQPVLSGNAFVLSPSSRAPPLS